MFQCLFIPCKIIVLAKYNYDKMIILHQDMCHKFYNQNYYEFD